MRDPGRKWILALAAAATIAGAGCAEERDPINQVQPHALEKSFFVGEDLLSPHDDPEFYAQATLVDVPFGANEVLAPSHWAQSLSRIKWVIQEDVLLARLAYERIEGVEGRGAGPATTDGIIVGAWRIEKHFDIQRQYNPSTGEELNVIVENSTDRPWYERKYMRVDWSENLNVSSYDFDTLSFLGLLGVKYEPLKYTINDPRHRDAPRFDLKNGYFDVTNKALAAPDEIRFRWGSIPSCFLPVDWGGGPAMDCNAAEITVRHAFKKVVDSDYEPVDWDGHRFAAAGAFTQERQGYTRRFGMTDDKWYRLAARYNIWQRSHYYADPEKMTGEVACYTPETTPFGKSYDRDENGDGTDDECEAVGRGSRCDPFKQRCTLPYRDRETRTIAWYFTEDGDYDFWDGTEWATHDWDVALRAAVMSARYVECNRTGGQDCAETYPVLSGQQVDQDDAIWLAREVDACRAGKAWHGEDCHALAERLGNERGFSRAAIATAQMEEMIVLCHSPVEADDHEACGHPRLPKGITARQCQEARAANDASLIATCDQALSARVGDLRYHQVNVFPQPRMGGIWGIMVDSVDPLTGEKVAASINIWSATTDLWSQNVIDTARYIKGELSTEQITDGQFVRDWVEAVRRSNSTGALEKMTRSELDERIASFANVSPAQLASLRQSPQLRSPELRQAIAKDLAAIRAIRADVRANSAWLPMYEARRERVTGTTVEAALLTPMMQQLAGNAKLSYEDTMDLVSPLRGGNPLLARELRHQREHALAERGACILEQDALAPFGIPVLADHLEEKFGAFNPNDGLQTQLDRAERMRRYIAQRAHYAVIAHEMGHSIGLRHNFVSSSDAFGYMPQYWQLRTSNGTATEPCEDLDPTGACVGPRYFDPVTEEEQKNLIGMFMRSTVMEYPGEVTQDLVGVASYDFHAARMIYGDVAAVHADPSYRVRTPRGTAMLEKVDSFGGTVGFLPTIGSAEDPLDTERIHYSQMQNAYQLIRDCEEVDPVLLRPSTWDEEKMGRWNPLLDGLIVSVNGRYTRCKQQPVDFVAWRDLRRPRSIEAGGEAEVRFANSGPAVDRQGRTRVPYGFATDHWADLGNIAVFRHDNGADPYELFDFLITRQEVGHIFDNYRRNRTTFSVRGAAQATLSRYNEKLRDAAKGLALTANIMRDRGLALGFDADAFWALVADFNFPDNVLASQIAFDHFTRMLARPEPGPHFLPTAGTGLNPGEPVLRSDKDAVGNVGLTRVIIPNGATGLWGNVGYGGKPVENAYAPSEVTGDYRTEYVINSGSYYDKAYTAYLMTESYDNFVSDSRSDFTDSRYRAVSLADVFPDGYRRWLANNLTGDDFIKGPRIATRNGLPVTDAQKYPREGIGWTSWHRAEGPIACFQHDDNRLCRTDVSDTVAIDPQVGWEQQKFLIAWTLWFLPENAKQGWINQMRVWELGEDADPGFSNRIEFHDPEGKVYVARTFGREQIFGKTVQKGIAARVLEYANELLAKAYVTTPVDHDGDGVIDWYEPVYENGRALVRFDPGIAFLDEEGNGASGKPGCNATENWSCTCSANRACMELAKYTEIPFYLRESLHAYGFGNPWMK